MPKKVSSKKKYLLPLKNVPEGILTPKAIDRKLVIFKRENYITVRPRLSGEFDIVDVWFDTKNWYPVSTSLLIEA